MNYDVSTGTLARYLRDRAKASGELSEHDKLALIDASERLEHLEFLEGEHTLKVGAPNRYRMRTVSLEAIEFTCDNWHKVVEFTDGKAHDLLIERRRNDRVTCTVDTAEGPVTVTQGDYLIRGLKGAICPCDPSVFTHLYLPV